MSDVITEVPAAGWYQDPNDDAAMRWWDGTTWTDHTQAIAPVSASPVGHRAASTEGSAGGEWESNYTDDELALYTGRPTELTSGSTTGRTMLDFTGTVPDWRRDRVTAQTGGAWLLAVSPLLWVIFSVFWTLLEKPLGLPTVSPFVAIPALLVLELLFAALDRRTLARRGIARPNYLFILLGPLVYLIARAVVVRRSSASGIGPLVLNIVSGALLGALVVLSVAGAMLFSGGSGSPGIGQDAATRHRTEQTVEQQLKQRGVNATVDCSGVKVGITPNSSFHCVETTQDGAHSDLVVAIASDGTVSSRPDGTPTPAP